jgi:hypothetical protein
MKERAAWRMDRRFDLALSHSTHDEIHFLKESVE